VRVLFDQGTPEPLRQLLAQHEVVTAFERGWSKLTNGELLDAAEREGYAVLVTTDSNLKYNKTSRPGVSRSLCFPHQAGHGFNARAHRSSA
jgi:hypothetical protein